MILNKTDSDSYKELFIQKFTNFAEKAPIVLSFVISDDGVSIVHETSGLTYFYYWDYVIPVKTFIHDIKSDLVKNHYPRVARKITVTRELTSQEQANLIAKGQDINSIPNTITEEIEETYYIDKFLIMKDEFILVNQDTKEQFCYKMDSSGHIYLKNYRNGKFTDLFQAGDEFFKKSTLVRKLSKLED